MKAISIVMLAFATIFGVCAHADASDPRRSMPPAAKAARAAERPAPRTPPARDIAVLGRYLQSSTLYPKVVAKAYEGYYAKVAKKTGARRFNVPTKQYDRMSTVEKWRANRKFLDRAVVRNSAVRLSTRPS